MLEPINYIDSVVECLCGNDVWGKPGDRCTHCIAEMDYIELLNALDNYRTEPMCKLPGCGLTPVRHDFCDTHANELEALWRKPVFTNDFFSSGL
jgi:hypothetical protein